jgi:hypothetical protein
MFGSLLLPIWAYLIYLWRSWRPVGELYRGLLAALGIVLALWILALLFGQAITFLPNLGGLYMSKIGAADRLTLLRAALQLRLLSPGGWITLTLLLAATLGLLMKGIGDRIPQSTNPPTYQSTNLPHIFTLLLILLGTFLVLGPEFFYLLDLFGTRMNTIFKFYYQAWLLWGVAAAFGVAVLLVRIKELRRVPSTLFTLGLVLLLGMGLTYTVLGVWQKTQGFHPETGLTLDGTAYLERANPDEMAAVRWLRAAPPGVVAEAVGGSYSGYARISMLSGLPTVLGWEFHEVQWRGTGEQTAVRKEDIQRLYCARSWDVAQSLIDQYDIRYIYVGSLERMTYTPGQNACAAGLNQGLFDRYLPQAFHQGDVTVYQVR